MNRNAAQPPFLWERHSVIIPPLPRGSGWTKHCQMPTPLNMGDGRIRVYYNGRSLANKAHVLFVDIEDRAPYTILSRPQTACFAPGKTGYFDAEGVMPTSVIQRGEEIWMYYIGWTMRSDVPYHNGIGLARSQDGGVTFERMFDGPIVGTSIADPLFCSTADVLKIGDQWVMYYASTTHWLLQDDKMEPRYHLRIATSPDGVSWTPTGKVAVDYRNDQEAATARATVLKGKSAFHMWFCTRNIDGYRTDADAAYHLDYATSEDGFHWQRSEKGTSIFANQFADELAFDKIMQAYPAIYEGPDGPIMFYNGDGFGQTGIAVAVPSIKA